MSISIIVLTKNSEKTLAKCLKSVAFADETLIIDDFSTDSTVKIAKKFKAKVYKRNLNSNFSDQRNFGLLKANSDWVLFLDADETFIGSLSWIDSQYDGYRMKRVDIFKGKKMLHGEVGAVKTLRLAKKSKGKWKRQVHEYWDIKGKIGDLKNIILHDAHPNITSFISKINFYAIIHQSENIKEGKSVNLFKVFFFPIFKFLNSFVIKKGFLDGEHGFVYAATMSFHSFLVWSSLWLKKK